MITMMMTDDDSDYDNDDKVTFTLYSDIHCLQTFFLLFKRANQLSLISMSHLDECSYFI